MTKKRTSLPAPLPATPETPTPATIEASLNDRLSFTPVPRRAKRWNGLTPLKQETFINNLASCGCVEMAAASVGASDTAFYNLRRAEGAESFAAAWEVAIDIGARIVLDKLMEHAIHGTPETLLKDGQVILERRKYNTRAMMWIVSQRFPEQYGSATGLMDVGGMSHAMRKLKAKWEEEWKAQYDAAANLFAQERRSEEEATRAEQRKEILPAALVKIYQYKVREERRYRLTGQTTHADLTLRQLTHIELYMEFGGLVEPEIARFFDSAATDPHPWESEAGRAIAVHREAAWARDEHQTPRHPRAEGVQSTTVSGQQTNAPILRPAPLTYGPTGPMHAALRGGETMTERTRARDQAERQMAEAQALWEACATEESWAAFAEK